MDELRRKSPAEVGFNEPTMAARPAGRTWDFSSIAMALKYLRS
jgi:hypothetical protein